MAAGGAVLQHRALVHHDDPARQSHDEFHVVLDDQEQAALGVMRGAQEAAERIQQAGIDAGGGFVQQQPARARLSALRVSSMRR